MELHNLKAPSGANKNRKRVGRGQGCHGRTATRGNNGQKARSGYTRTLGFEGGQMPLYRRVPKRGFSNKFAKRPVELNLRNLADIKDISEFTPEILAERGVVKGAKYGIKVVGNFDLKRSIKLKVHKISKGAKEKIEKAGGSIEVIG
jgi:large subunit ribosomal protein L15